LSQVRDAQSRLYTSLDLVEPDGSRLMFVESFVEHVSALRRMFGASAVQWRQLAGAQLQRAAATASRTLVRRFFAGSPLTPTGYALVAITLGAAAMTALLPISSIGPELDRALRLSWWFS
jgi:hypothetical protein